MDNGSFHQLFGTDSAFIIQTYSITLFIDGIELGNINERLFGFMHHYIQLIKTLK